MSGVKARFEKAVLNAFCKQVQVDLSANEKANIYQCAISGGELQGMSFSMPRLERLSFKLGSYEPQVVNAMVRHVRKGMVCYDVGANAGYLSLVLSKLAQEEGRVYSFEPDPKNLSALKANLRNNRRKNMTIVEKAVSDKSGKVTFASFDYSLVGHIAHETTPEDASLFSVEAISLDDFVFIEKQPAPDFIKIDVEGAELQVFEGGMKAIERHRPIVLAEVRAGDIWHAIEKRMKALGYQAEFLKGWDMERDQLGDVLLLP